MKWCMNINKLAEITGGIAYNCSGDEIVKNVVRDDREVSDGTVFVALKGENNNGHPAYFLCIFQEQGNTSVRPLRTCSFSRPLASFHGLLYFHTSVPAYLIYSNFINYCCNQKTGYGYRILP